MSKLPFDLINLILSFRPAHPVAVLIKNKKEELSEKILSADDSDTEYSEYTTQVCKRVNGKWKRTYEINKGYEKTIMLIKKNFEITKPYFKEINYNRHEILQKLQNNMFCYSRVNDINKVNKFMERFFIKNRQLYYGEIVDYYYNENADKRFFNETEEDRIIREKDEEREREEQNEFMQEISDEYYREHENYNHYG